MAERLSHIWPEEEQELEARHSKQSPCSHRILRYLPATRIENVPGTMAERAGRSPGGTVGAVNSAATVKIRFVFASSVRVLARGIVSRVCSTVKLVGPFSFTIVSVPSFWELNASVVFGLNAAPSEPRPIGRVARIFPSPALRITMFCGLRQAAKRMLFFTSIARPAHPSPFPARS